jgi:hypothetical protein
VGCKNYVTADGIRVCPALTFLRALASGPRVPLGVHSDDAQPILA